MQYTEQELAKLISDLETEFTAHLAKAEASAAQEPLMKAEDEKEEKEPKSEEKEESKEAPAEEKEEQKEEAPEKEQKPEEAPAPQQNDESGYDQEEIAHMDKMYMSMSKAELLAHHDSCVRALDAIGAEHTHQQPEAQEQASAPEMDKAGMYKAENMELELAKSEVATYKAKTEELQKSLDAVQEFLTAFVKKVPQGKAVTSLEAITKSESLVEEKELSQSEINAILTKRASDPSLKKSDRDAINAYYFNDKNINKISHLLK